MLSLYYSLASLPWTVIEGKTEKDPSFTALNTPSHWIWQVQKCMSF